MRKYIISVIFTVAMCLITMQLPGQPPPDNNPSQQGGPVPIGGGLIILVGLGMAYGAKKVYDARRCKNE